jgi:drug/metabolite transporter (DMT)-like permease
MARTSGSNNVEAGASHTLHPNHSRGECSSRSRDDGACKYYHVSGQENVPDGEENFSSEVADNNNLSIGHSDSACSNSFSSSYSTTLLAWVSILLATISGAAIGPTFKDMEELSVPPVLAVSWRCQCMIVFLIPILIYQYYDPKIPKIQWMKVYPGLRYPYIYYIVLDSIAWSLNVISWVIGVKYTTTVRASVFANTHPLMLVTVLYLTGSKVQLLEWVGVSVIMCGICYSFVNQLDDFVAASVPATTNTGQQSTVFGDSLCLIAAFADMVLVLIRTKTTPHMTTLQYTGYTSLGIVLISTICSLYMDGTPENPVGIFCLQEDCVFGWMNGRWVCLMLIFGLTVGVVCIAGFNYAVQHLPPLVFSAAALVDPALTGLISWVCGIEGIPNQPTIIGGVIIVMGVYMISSVEKPEETVGGIADSASDNGTDVTEHACQPHFMAAPTTIFGNTGVEMTKLLSSSHNGNSYNTTSIQEDNC